MRVLQEDFAISVSKTLPIIPNEINLCRIFIASSSRQSNDEPFLHLSWDFSFKRLVIHILWRVGGKILASIGKVEFVSGVWRWLVVSANNELRVVKLNLLPHVQAGRWCTKVLSSFEYFWENGSVVEDFYIVFKLIKQKSFKINLIKWKALENQNRISSHCFCS